MSAQIPEPPLNATWTFTEILLSKRKLGAFHIMEMIVGSEGLRKRDEGKMTFKRFFFLQNTILYEKKTKAIATMLQTSKIKLTHATLHKKISQLLSTN